MAKKKLFEVGSFSAYRDLPSLSDIPDEQKRRQSHERDQYTQNRKSYASNSKIPIDELPELPDQDRFAGAKHDPCHFTYSWQKEAINILTKNDGLFLCASPSAGKTPVIMCYWLKEILQVNPDFSKAQNQSDLQVRLEKILFDDNFKQSLPKLVISLPTRTLNNELYDNTCNTLFGLIRQYLNSYYFKPNGETKQPNRNQLKKVLGKISNNNSYNDIIDQYFDLRVRLYQNPNQTDLQQLQRIFDSMSQKLSKDITNYVKNKLVYKQDGTSKKGDPRTAIAFMGIHQATHKLVKNVGFRNVGLLVVDEAHRSLGYDSEDKNAVDISQEIYKTIMGKDATQSNLRFLFLTGTLNPESGKEFVQYARRITNNQVKIKMLKTGSEAGNPSRVYVIPNDKLLSSDFGERFLTNPQGKHNLIVCFGKQQILNIVQAAISKTGKRTTKQVESAKDEQISHVRSDINDKKQTLGDFYDKPPEIEFQNDSLLSDIYSPIQQAAIRSGFGYIFNQDFLAENVEEKEKYANDLKIVSDLFSKGQIHTVIATDAVGIGLNLDIKTMYLPSSNKPGGGGVIDKIPLDEFCQFLNRIGRSKYPTTEIHVPAAYIDDVTKAVSAITSEFDKRVVIDLDNEEAEVQYTKVLRDQNTLLRTMVTDFKDYGKETKKAFLKLPSSKESLKDVKSMYIDMAKEFRSKLPNMQLKGHRTK